MSECVGGEKVPSRMGRAAHVGSLLGSQYGSPHTGTQADILPCEHAYMSGYKVIYNLHMSGDMEVCSFTG